MSWITFSEGPSLDSMRLLVPDAELPKGTPVRFELDLNLPVAQAFDIAGAELIFKDRMPEGLILTDVYAEGNWRVIIEAESDPAFLLAIPTFIAAHWLTISLVTIGIAVSLGFLISAIRGKTLSEAIGVPSFTGLAWAVAFIAGLIILKDYLPGRK